MFRTILLLTKGIIRDMRLRRLMMFWVSMVAIMLFAGGMIWVNDPKWGSQHPWMFFGYWLLCAWLTVLSMLLAMMDILVLRAAQRAARRVLEAQILDAQKKEDARKEEP